MQRKIVTSPSLLATLLSLCLSAALPCAAAEPTIETVSIPQIQGHAHRSVYDQQRVVTHGVVTMTNRKGFTVQDPVGDNDPATSDALYVYSRHKPSVSIGDWVEITGKVIEYVPGGKHSHNLSITEIIQPNIRTLSRNHPLPTPVIIGRAGRRPPTELIEDDALARYEPKTDGIDFYESLEFMRLSLPDTVAVSASNRFGEVYVLTDNGIDATSRNARGGITWQAGDANPERLQIQFNQAAQSTQRPTIQTADKLGNIIGVLGYSFGNYELYPTQDISVTSSDLSPAPAPPQDNRPYLQVVSYNVYNLDPNDQDGDKDVAQGRFRAIAQQLVTDLHSPDIIALQEIQDNSGTKDNAETQADITLKTLVTAITQAGGPYYQFIDAPPLNNQDGGQPGGNIRVTYLFNPAHVKRIAGSVQRLSDGDAFEQSRKSLAVSFQVEDEVFHLVNNHLASKANSTPLFGAVQPPINGREAKRTAQAQVIAQHIATLMTHDPDANIIVLGDLNDFAGSLPLQALTHRSPHALVNLTETLAPEERYTFNYQGNAQALDHILVSPNLLQRAHFEIQHLNSEFSHAVSDHDPIRLQLQPPP